MWGSTRIPRYGWVCEAAFNVQHVESLPLSRMALMGTTHLLWAVGASSAPKLRTEHPRSGSLVHSARERAASGSWH